MLSREGMRDADIELVWDAIALHTTVGVPPRKRPEIALVQLGAAIDVGFVSLEMVAAELPEGRGEPLLAGPSAPGNAEAHREFNEDVVEVNRGLATAYHRANADGARKAKAAAEGNLHAADRAVLATSALSFEKDRF